MNKVIKLPARYGNVHTLQHINGNLWQFRPDPKSAGHYRCIGFEGQHEIGPNIKAFDPDGGPFMSVGGKIEDYTIKSITTSGVFELIKE